MGTQGSGRPACSRRFHRLALQLQGSRVVESGRRGGSGNPEKPLFAPVSVKKKDPLVHGHRAWLNQCRGHPHDFKSDAKIAIYKFRI